MAKLSTKRLQHEIDKVRTRLESPPKHRSMFRSNANTDGGKADPEGRYHTTAMLKKHLNRQLQPGNANAGYQQSKAAPSKPRHNVEYSMPYSSSLNLNYVTESQRLKAHVPEQSDQQMPVIAVRTAVQQQIVPKIAVTKPQPPANPRLDQRLPPQTASISLNASGRAGGATTSGTTPIETTIEIYKQKMEVNLSASASSGRAAGARNA